MIILCSVWSLGPYERKGSRDQSAEYNFSEICKISQLFTSKSDVIVLNKAAGRAYQLKELFFRECQRWSAY